MQPTQGDFSNRDYEFDVLNLFKIHLLEKLATHYSAKGPQHHHHKSGLFSRLFGQNG